MPNALRHNFTVCPTVSNSHGSTHTGYTLELEEAFAVQKAGLPCKDTGKKRMLLWHGSRLSNWSGILQQGLKIAPPEAPVTGYMVRSASHPSFEIAQDQCHHR